MAAVRAHTPEPHRLVVVDNGSEAEVVAWLKDARGKGLIDVLILNDRNLGVAAAAVVGWLIGRSTDRPIVRAIVRQVLFTVIPALITFAIGNALGVGTG